MMTYSIIKFSAAIELVSVGLTQAYPNHING